MVALLEPLALPRLPRRELGGTRPERLLPVAQTAELRGQPLALATRAMYSAATTTSERSRLVVWSALYCCAFFACRSSEASWRLTSSMTSRTRTRFCRAASSLPWVSLRCCL